MSLQRFEIIAKTVVLIKGRYGSTKSKNLSGFSCYSLSSHLKRMKFLFESLQTLGIILPVKTYWYPNPQFLLFLNTGDVEIIITEINMSQRQE